MRAGPFIIAQLEPVDVESAWRRLGPARAGFVTLVGAISIVVLVVIIWALFIRKPSEDRPRRYKYPRPDKASANGQSKSSENSGDSSGEQPRRKRRRRRGHRHLNPTLAEAGGLPPVRNDVRTDDPP
ncbi:MAG TPA: hypothetical protein VLT36_05870 [Candidatus Dormibacteraeota bacterium]|nr:hypothetical protein [Candidatus Dormibacteraeota bacterium]